MIRRALALLLLSGCAYCPQRCADSAMCRALIEDRPPAMVAAVNDSQLCDSHARRALAVMDQQGIETRRYVVRLRPVYPSSWRGDGAQSILVHTFAAGRIDGRWYAVDNGALPFCDRVCRLDEALHGVDLIEYR